MIFISDVSGGGVDSVTANNAAKDGLKTFKTHAYTGPFHKTADGIVAKTKRLFRS